MKYNATALKEIKNISNQRGSARIADGPPGLQIRCGAIEPSQVVSIPMHFRKFIRKIRFLANKLLNLPLARVNLPALINLYK